jgi:predicted anti-sigma-YlaC factor YlaD
MTADLESLSCQELVELVTDYLEGALSEAERARFEEHLRPCGGCRGYVEQMRQTIEVVGRLSVDVLTPEAERDLLEAFRGWRSA